MVRRYSTSTVPLYAHSHIVRAATAKRSHAS